jgi:uncharacterized protein YggE
MADTDGTNKNRLNVRLDLRWVSLVLLVIIIVMLAVWRPWESGPTDASRTITVTGESTLKTAPDEYVFYPQYTFKDADKTAALADLTATQDEIVAGLKKLGVADNKIKADSSGYNYNYYFDDTNKTYNYTLALTVTVDDKALTQKVQDYLVSTSPTGSVSPQASFSDAVRKKLESQGRDAATKEARSKADQSAKNLGFKVGKVKSVSDSGNGGGIMPMYSTMEAGDSSAAKQSLAVQPGENELSYSVTVVYYVK